MALDHLKRYVMFLDGQAVSQFFLYLTGSNVITCESTLQLVWLQVRKPFDKGVKFVLAELSFHINKS